MNFFLKPWTTKENHTQQPKLDLKVKVSSQQLTFHLEASIEQLCLHKSELKNDQLWKSTCFELFLCSPKKDHYFEWNFSLDKRFFIFEFDGIRQEKNRWTGFSQKEKQILLPQIFDLQQTKSSLDLIVDLDLVKICDYFFNTKAARIKPTSVINTTATHNIYLAPFHAKKNHPDFHDFSQSHCILLSELDEKIQTRP